MTSMHNTVAPVAATLTEQELFNRFLDAPFRNAAPLSTLIDYYEARPKVSVLNCIGGWCESICFEEEMPLRIIEELRDCEDPACEIGTAIDDLKVVLGMLETLKREFDALTNATRTPMPEETGDEDADDQAYAEWSENPRYVLPVIKTSVEAA